MHLVLILVALIVFIVFATSKLKLNPFITLLLASFLAAFVFGLPVDAIEKNIRTGFGNILGYIGLVIVLGTIIGVILERTGAAIVMAETIIKALGKRFPTLTMSLVGFVVSIPVFCDSGFVILNSLKRSMARTLSASPVAMTVALSTGLFATHTLVPPTPGPIAAAGNLGLENNLGLVIAVGLVFAVIAVFAGLFWASRCKNLESKELELAEEAFEEARERYGELPSAWAAFAPIFVPIVLICLGSVANYPTAPLGDGGLYELLNFLGKPLNALMIGLAFALMLLQGDKKLEEFARHTQKGLEVSAPIILITGAGGAFGGVLAQTPLGEYLGDTLSTLGLGVIMPFIVAAALKSAQGSSTVALVTTSALVAPLLTQLGLDSELGRVLTVMAIGAGAMTVSHANDSYFWVVSQFSKMDVATAYRSHTAATLVMGLVTILCVWLVSLMAL
ncbi:GntP family permease [Marinobacter salinexigens]|uniref:GntP family permease n=1 Tax=Marinobacter salinexigens TaxID=2919747 RepID=A0A5B0VNW3_9GAMM|nr:GntP family permease [Marinobacter salinexigens]KAA1176123.1 GntP family permease [Marinobacter salinexigens]